MSADTDTAPTAHDELQEQTELLLAAFAHVANDVAELRREVADLRATLAALSQLGERLGSIQLPPAAARLLGLD